MNIYLLAQSLILGLVQGLTEFLPVSSSAHLVILQEFFPIFKTNAISFDLVLHLGTLLALIIFFFKDFRKIITNKQLIINLLIATAITAILIFPFKNYIENVFQNGKLAGLMLIITAIILLFASFKKNNNLEILNPLKACFIGLGQALAVFPGISRSGTTISFGIFSGLKTDEAIKFSFLLALPIIFGASVLERSALFNMPKEIILPSIFGFLFSFIFGLIALRWLKKFISLTNKNLIYFALYCFLVGFFAIIVL